MLLAALGAALPAAARADAAPVPLTAKVSACTTGATAAARTAVFTGSMPADPRAVRLGMRFELRELPDGARHPRRVRAGSFGAWQRSEPGAGGYVVDKRVEGLHAGSSYRVSVRFRWYDADGTVVRTATRLSGACRQPDRRPDLRVTGVTVEPGAAGLPSTYRVTVRNDGRSATADPFGVVLVAGDMVLRPADPMAPLAPGSSRTVAITGPACAPGTALRAVADSEDDVEESDEQDNVLTRPC